MIDTGRPADGASHAVERLVTPRLAVAFATMLFVSGLPNTFPVFFPALLAEFGGSRAATALTVTLLWTGSALLGPLAGVLVDRWNPRLVVASGLGATALGLTGAVLAPSLLVFIVSLGVGGGIGIALTGMVAQATVIAGTYTRRRGFATGLAFSGSMAGYVLSTPAHWAMMRIGWRATLGADIVFVLALVPAVFLVYPSRLGARAAPAAAHATADPRLASIVRSVPFWALAIVWMTAPLVGYFVTVQHALYVTSLGFAPEEAAAMLTLGGVLSVTGRSLSGLVADRFGGPAAGFVSFGLSLSGALCLLALGFHPTRALAYAYVVFVFLPLGSRATIVSVLVGRLAPPALFGTVFGLLATSNNVGAALGPFLSGALYDLTGSYHVLYATAAALLAVALSALTVFVRTTARTRVSQARPSLLRS